MPKKDRKPLCFRKFRQIPAKMRLGSQCLCGVSEDTVEMKRARWGRWHNVSCLPLSSVKRSRNEKSPLRASTHPFPLRFWHYAGSCRNEKSPMCIWRLNERKYRPTLYIWYRKVTKSLFQDMYCILSRSGNFWISRLRGIFFVKIRFWEMIFISVTFYCI